MTRCPSTRALRLLPFLLALTVSPATAQIVVTRPALEAGFRAVLGGAPTSGIGGSPHLTWNMTERTSVELSTDLLPAQKDGATTARQRLGFVDVKHTVFEPRLGRLFLTVGGLAGVERRHTSQPTYVVDNGRLVLAPQQLRRGLGGVTIGAGYDRVLARHLSFTAQTQLLVMDRVGVRALVGFSTPLGSYRLRQHTAGPTSAKLSDVRTGDKVWVTMADGTLWKGRVVVISMNEIELSEAGVITPLAIERVKKIETTDGIGDGARHGLLAGALSAIPATLAVVSTCGDDSECGYYAGLFGVVWGAIGAGVGTVIGALADSLHEGRRTVYDAGVSIRLSPIVGLHKAGVGGSIRW